MNLWKSDAELFSIVRRELFTCVVGDVMDVLGLRKQFLPPQIQPLREDMVAAGRAMPVLGISVCEAVFSNSANPPTSREFGIMFEALDDLKEHEIYICTGSAPNHANWGELMATRALKLGAAGAVCDGYTRDTRGILKLNFPTFSYGRYGQDSRPRYKVVDFRVPIEIGGVRIEPGDFVFGDIDGVCIIPRKAEIEVFTAALEKVRGEKRVKQAIEEGSSAREAWDRFGIM